MKKAAVIAAAVSVVAALAYYYAGYRGGNGVAAAVKTVEARRADLRIEVVSSGVVVPAAEVVVKSKAGGEITSFPFKEGDVLKKGRTVVMLDPRTEKSRTKQAEASLLLNRARLEKAEISSREALVRLDRHRSLFEGGVVSRQELDDAETGYRKSLSDVHIAEAELIQAEEALNEAKERLKDTEIKSPLDGTILEKLVDEGQVISSSLSSASEGTALFSMANLDYIYVNAKVDEVDIGSVSEGQEAAVTVDARPDRVFRARVSGIAPKGTVERTVTVFEVVVEVVGEDKSMLKPGMTADVRILTSLRKDALLVPNEAVRLRDGATGVYVAEDGRLEWRGIETGATDGVDTEVLKGIAPGARVSVSAAPAAEGKAAPRRGFFF
jgi:RND family efflux transporter MFP subunit